MVDVLGDREPRRGQTETVWTWLGRPGGGGGVQMSGCEGHDLKEKKKKNVGCRVPAGGKLLSFLFGSRSTKVAARAFFLTLLSFLFPSELSWQTRVLQEDIRRLSRNIKSRQEARGLMCCGGAQMSVPTPLRRSLYGALLDFC